MGFLSCSPFGGRGIAPPQRRAPSPASEHSCRQRDGGAAWSMGRSGQHPRPKGAGTHQHHRTSSSPHTQLCGREAHLRLYFPSLFNREKKNHKKSGISVFRCRTIPKQPLPWKKITAFAKRPRCRAELRREVRMSLFSPPGARSEGWEEAHDRSGADTAPVRAGSPPQPPPPRAGTGSALSAAAGATIAPAAVASPGTGTPTLRSVPTKGQCSREPRPEEGGRPARHGTRPQRAARETGSGWCRHAGVAVQRNRCVLKNRCSKSFSFKKNFKKPSQYGKSQI